MVSQRRLFTLFTLLLLVALMLVACERPFTSNDNTSSTNQTRTETINEIANTPPDTGVNDANEEVDEEAGGGILPETTPDAAEQPEAYPAPTDDEEVVEETADTPRVEPEDQATPTPEPAGAEESSTEETSTSEETETSSEAEQPASEEVEETPETTEPTATETDTHTVAVGENLYRIGLKYGISWVTLAEINNLSNPNDIKVGQVLQLSEDTTPDVEPTPSPLTETTYTVRAGDNLYKIGLAYGITWVQIAEANGIVNPNQIFVGQVLKIPVEAPGPAPQFTHTVQPGETLYLISLQYGVAWPTIAEANELESPYVIYAGQVLVIPGGG